MRIPLIRVFLFAFAVAAMGHRINDQFRKKTKLKKTKLEKKV